MLKASCSGTVWELVLHRNTDRNLFSTLPCLYSLFNPLALLSKEPYNQLPDHWNQLVFGTSCSDKGAFRHALLPSASFTVVSTTLGVVSLTENLRPKTVELGNVITDRKAYSVARAERLQDSWFSYCCLLIRVAQLPQKREKRQRKRWHEKYMRETQESQKDHDKQVEDRDCVLPIFDPFEHWLESLCKGTLPGAGNDIS